MVLDSQPTAEVSITVTSGEREAATVSPSTLTFTPSTWATPQKVTVTGVDDGMDQSSDRSVSIAHRATSTDSKYNGISISDVTATVVDDDGAGVSISKTSATVREDGATTATYGEVRLDGRQGIGQQQDPHHPAGGRDPSLDPTRREP